MAEFFINLLNVSITASFLIIAVIVYRRLAKRAPKWIYVLLWGFVGLRLLLPLNIESSMSLIPSKSTIPTAITTERYPFIESGFERIDEAVNPILSSSMTASPESGSYPISDLLTVIGYVWVGVMICMMLYMAASFILLRIKTRVRVEREGGVYLCDNVRTPFILGILKPVIFLPSDISDKDYQQVLAHERAHIKRLDHIWKPLGFLLLSVYWFNPLLWVAYLLLCRDIEGACDEKVLSQLGESGKKDYSEALLTLGASSRIISACPLAFGEVSVKTRICAIAKYKRPATKIIIVSVTVCTLIAACFMTYKKSESVAVEEGIWYAGRVIGTKDRNATLDNVPRFVFTEGGDILVESNDLSGPSYVKLGAINTAYVSLGEYERLFKGMTFRSGYDPKYFHSSIRSALRITPSVGAGIGHDEVYLLRSEGELFMGYADSGSIDTLYELKFNETLPTYLYTLTYTAPGRVNTSLLLDSSNGTASITFGDSINYTALGIYKYENSRLIFKSTDSFELKLVFYDVGNALIYSEAESDLKGFTDILPDGITFEGYYRLYNASSCNKWFDINGDKMYELISANVRNDGSLGYLVHVQGKTLASGQLPFERYDSIRFEDNDGVLYLVGEYSETDFREYRYAVGFDGESLILTPQ